MNQKVDPDRIQALSAEMLRLGRRMGESGASLTKEISNLISDIRRAYPEDYVQSAASEVDRLNIEIQQLIYSIDIELGSKANTLKRVAQDYVRVEKETEQKIKNAIQQTTFQTTTVGMRAGNPADLTKRVKLVSETKEPEELDELVKNEINLNMLLRQYLDEIGYELFPGEVSVEVTMDEHVLEFWGFALSKGYDPRTFEYLEYRDRSEAYRQLEERTSGLKQGIQDYKEHMLDGFELLAFGRGFYLGLENSVNNTAEGIAQIVSHPLESAEALLQDKNSQIISLVQSLEVNRLWLLAH
ncbi:hypothetical protein [Fontibacillus sp. BL9]|uniref:hypothetical protein n=1 Tax=Fontibacillus sp. BL9 TaxID=3389971 RepID=UPI003978A278